MKGPVQSFEVTYLVHATEDAGKIAGAVAGAFGITAPYESEELQGHFGNTISRVRVHLTGVDAEQALDELAWKLRTAARSQLLEELGKRVDEHGALFIRFDKQSMVLGRLVFGEEDSVRVKVKPRAFLMKGSPQQLYSELLERK